MMTTIKKHSLLLLLLILFAGITTLYSLTLPLGEISDAGAHFRLIRFIAETGRPPLNNEERFAVGIKGDASPIYHGLVAMLTQPRDISELPELPEIHEKSERSLPDDERFIRGHFHTEDERPPYRGIVLAWHLAGLASVPLGMLTVTLIYLSGLQIFPQQRHLALAMAALVAFTPRFVISSGVVNDDNLVFPLITAALYALIRLIRGDTRRRTLVALGACSGLATITKYHALLLLPQILLIGGLLAWRRGWGWRTTLNRSGLVILTFALTAGWWLLFVSLQFNDPTDTDMLTSISESLGDPVLTAGLTQLRNFEINRPNFEELTYWLSWTFRSFWLHYNGLYTGLLMMGHHSRYWFPFWLLALLTGGAALGLLRKLGLLCEYRRHPSDAALLITLLLTLHLGLYLSLALLRYSLQPAWATAQGRHLYPALLTIACGFVSGWQALFPIPRPRLLLMLLGGGPLLLTLLSLPLLIWPVYYPYLPLTSRPPDEIAIPHRLEHEFAAPLRLEGYDLPSTMSAGHPLPVTLYWRAQAKIERDYLVTLCLHAPDGRLVTCQPRHPVNGRYPTRAWERPYLVRDEHFLATPSCLPAGEYHLTLSLQPLRRDTAISTLSGTPEPPLNLGRLTITETDSSPPPFAVWHNGQQQGRHINIWQLRTGFTMLTTHSTPPQFVTYNEGATWQPLTKPIRYACPAGGPTISSYTFLTHAAVKPGRYQLLFGEVAQRQPTVRVTTRPRQFIPPTDVGTPLVATFAEEVRLLGYQADLEPRQPNDTVIIETTWQALRTMSDRHVGSIHLLDPMLTMWAQADHPLGGPYPNLLWVPGEVVTDPYYLVIPPHVAPGRYRLKLSVYDYRDGQFISLPATQPHTTEPVVDLPLGQLRVRDPAATAPPPMPLVVTLGQQIQLRGYTIESEALRREQPFRFGLYWQALRPPTEDYTVFTQLLGPAGQVWAQQDNQPQGGSYPTSEWGVGEPLIDRYQLVLPAAAPPGAYRLLVGMYELSTGQRLPALTAPGEPLPHNAISIGPFTLTE